MLPSASLGTSKSGAATKVTIPVLVLMANFAASAPPVIEKLSVGAGKSASVALTAITVPVPFSAKLDVVADTKTGLNSLTGVTVMDTDWVAVRVPSDAVICRS